MYRTRDRYQFFAPLAVVAPSRWEKSESVSAAHNNQSTERLFPVCKNAYISKSPRGTAQLAWGPDYYTVHTYYSSRAAPSTPAFACAAPAQRLIIDIVLRITKLYYVLRGS